MKYPFGAIVFFFLFSFVAAGQTTIEKVMRKYKNDEGVISLNYAGDLSNLIQSKNGKLKTKINSCDVLIFEGNKNISDNDKVKLKSAMSADKYETLMSVKDKRGKMNIHAISSGETLQKVFAEVTMENKNIYLIFTGNIYFEELGSLNLNFDGGKELKNLLN